MAKIQIKSEKLTPFGVIFSIMEKVDSTLSPIIDRTLGQRCSSIIGYQFSEIVRSLMSDYFCGGSCVEDVTSKNNFFQNFLPKSLQVSKRNRNFVVWYIATSIIVKR